ncbi:PREDICTED: spermatogenesis-associated protein 5 isoform X1 [Polistes canadensis]|uniref:spermatogenesis-associated protein 5 isoform X1 n=2 Tax=Polistes canadensis TaxID=91411 RepID=UPI000719072C|nr:PREDICTED: spermatogenesis-associated protein 5 isoform X1 [Polistes canadensis]
MLNTHIMSPKVRKSLSSLTTCEKCQCIYGQNDVTLHESNCPPSFDNWNHSFIFNDTLHSTLEIYKAPAPTNISAQDLNDMVFLSQTVMQLCNIAIADPVIIATKNSIIVKIAWLANDKSLLSVSLPKSTIELNNLKDLIKVQSAKVNIYAAKEIIVKCTGKHALLYMSTDLEILFKNSNEGKIFCIGNRISISYYGRKLIYVIVAASIDQNDDTTHIDDDLLTSFNCLHLTTDKSNVKYYKALYSTKYIIQNDVSITEEEQKKVKYKIEDIGGYNDLIADIKDVMDIALNKCNIGDFFFGKGILLYGTPGVGKSMIANAIISEYNINSFNVHSSDIYSKSMDEAERKLKDIFTEAKDNTPCIILLEDIDTLCPKRSSSSTDQGRRVLATIKSLFDELQNTKDNIIIIATTSKIEFVDASLRRPGRIDKEFEVYVPLQSTRLEILSKLLKRIPNTLLQQDLINISFSTHGFVGADIYGLCSHALMAAVKRQHSINVIDSKTNYEINVTIDDFNKALTVTKPSAMKEILVEVPMVRWSDIGGQRELKLKLKQSIEWPLRYPEAFTRMGITPPRGVLMFGPPGCSKTMIAKALATESKVNFLNIRGPELFSKWVGESEKAVRDVFHKARQVAPSIIFIDEIDALGGERGSSSGSNGSNVEQRVLAQLLTELDGITALGNVTLVAATNRPDKIDKALLRPGRLDRIIYVKLPDCQTRQEIFEIKLKKMPIAEDVNILDLVELTEGYSGAEIQAICHEAAMNSLEENLDAAIVTKDHFKVALSIVTPRTPTSLIQLYENYINKVY